MEDLGLIPGAVRCVVPWMITENGGHLSSGPIPSGMLQNPSDINFFQSGEYQSLDSLDIACAVRISQEALLSPVVKEMLP